MALRLWGSNASRANRVHWMLHELGLPYEKRLIGPRTGETQTPEFLKVNPAGKIPVLEDDDFKLTESAAINTYLGLKYGAGREFVPSEPRARAKYDQWCFFAISELDAQSLYIVRKHVALAHIYGEAPVAVDVARQTFVKQAGILSLAFDDGRPWIMGEHFGAADILLATCVAGGRAQGLAITGQLSSYVDRAIGREAYAAAQEAGTPA